MARDEFEPVVPSNEMLALERRIISTVEERGWTKLEDMQGDNDATVQRWEIEVDGTTYTLYVEPWDKRSCTKYNIITESDDTHNDEEWDEGDEQRVLDWFANHPTIKAN